MPARKPKVLRPIHANAGLAAWYRRKLSEMIDEMHASIVYWLLATYKQNPPQMAQDAISANELRDRLRRLARQWNRRFRDVAEEFAQRFGQLCARQVDYTMKRQLKAEDFSVEFRMTKAMRDVLNATVHQNVSLIKSIPQKYLGQVEVLVMQSVQAGRDLDSLYRALQQGPFNVTKKRAKLIAHQQNNSATAALTRARQVELGLGAVWLHSHAGKKPRPTHVRMHGKGYDPKKGMWDSHERQWVLPGQLINCFPASTSVQFADGVEKAFRRWYSGELTEIVTDSNKTFRATPNHPVLTPHGWVAIDALNLGDDIVEIADECIDPVVAKNNVNHAPVTISEIFEALTYAGTSRLEVAFRSQFHGDGIANGYVDVVSAIWPLSFYAKSLLLQSGRKHDFTVPNQTTLCRSFIQHFLLRSFNAAASFVSCLSQPFTPDIAFALHPDTIGSTSIANFTARGEDALDDTATSKVMELRQRQDTKPTLVLPTQLARIRKINHTTFDGHVFNLQTKSGWYVSQGIVTHNCRCSSKSVIA